MKRQSLRYNGREYFSVLICECGAWNKLVVYAPQVHRGQKSDSHKHILKLNQKIKDSGWYELMQKDFDQCPKCHARALATERYRRYRERKKELVLEQQQQDEIVDDEIEETNTDNQESS